MFSVQPQSVEFPDWNTLSQTSMPTPIFLPNPCQLTSLGINPYAQALAALAMSPELSMTLSNCDNKLNQAPPSTFEGYCQQQANMDSSFDATSAPLMDTRMQKVDQRHGTKTSSGKDAAKRGHSCKQPVEIPASVETKPPWATPITPRPKKSLPSTSMAPPLPISLRSSSTATLVPTPLQHSPPTTSAPSSLQPSPEATLVVGALTTSNESGFDPSHFASPPCCADPPSQCSCPLDLDVDVEPPDCDNEDIQLPFQLEEILCHPPDGHFGLPHVFRKDAEPDPLPTPHAEDVSELSQAPKASSRPITKKTSGISVSDPVFWPLKEESNPGVSRAPRATGVADLSCAVLPQLPQHCTAEDSSKCSEPSPPEGSINCFQLRTAEALLDLADLDPHEPAGTPQLDLPAKTENSSDRSVPSEAQVQSDECRLLDMNDMVDFSLPLQADGVLKFLCPDTEEIFNVSFAVEDEDVPQLSLPLQDMFESEAGTPVVALGSRDVQFSPPKVDIQRKRDPKTAALMQEPASSPTQAVAVARRLLNDGDIPAAMEVIRFWFCRKSRSPHMMRMIHFNPKNWVIIPYLPRRYREIAKDAIFAQRLRARLQSDEQWEVYVRHCRFDCSPEVELDDQTA